MAEYLRNRPFLCVEMTQRPASGVDTSKKGWQTAKGSLQTFDKVTIVDRVNNTMMSRAAVIIDIINSSVVKNNTDEDDTMLRAEYMSRYADDIKDSLTIWAHREAKTRVAQ